MCPNQCVDNKKMSWGGSYLIDRRKEMYTDTTTWSASPRGQNCKAQCESGAEGKNRWNEEVCCLSKLLGKRIRNLLFSKRLSNWQIQSLDAGKIRDVRMMKPFDMMTIDVSKYKVICRWMWKGESYLRDILSNRQQDEEEGKQWKKKR